MYQIGFRDCDRRLGTVISFAIDGHTELFIVQPSALNAPGISNVCFSTIGRRGNGTEEKNPIKIT